MKELPAGPRLAYSRSGSDSDTRGHGAVLSRVRPQSPAGGRHPSSLQRGPRALPASFPRRPHREEGCGRAELGQPPRPVCPPQRPTVSSPDSRTRATKPPSKLRRVRQAQTLRGRRPEARFSGIPRQPLRELAFPQPPLGQQWPQRLGRPGARLTPTVQRTAATTNE